MADPIDPTTPQIPPIPNPGFDNLAQQSVNFSGIIGVAFDKLNATINNLGTSITSLVSKFTGLNSAQNQIVDVTGKQSIATGFLTAGLLGAGNAFDNLKNKSSATQSIVSQLDQASRAGKVGTDVLYGMARAFESKGFTFKIGESLSDFVHRAAESSDQFLKLKNNYIQVVGASGGLNEAFGKSGSNLQGLNTIVEQHRSRMTDIASETHNSTAAVAQYWELLASAVPGAANKQIKAVDDAGTSTNQLTAIMRLAAGTGQDTAKVIEGVQKAWEAYGLEGRDALAFTSQIAEVNNNLGLRMDITQGFITKNSEAFKGITDNGNNAISVLNNMYDSFRKTGLSASASVDIIAKMTTGLKNLTVGQEAFLSAQSGGPGGLRGAIQIENQLRGIDGKGGDIEGVFKRAETALRKQFGGRIITAQEAEGSDQAASQFVRQRELLKSGAFGIKAEDNAMATRILEAFKNGTSATVAMKDKQSSLNDAMNRGEKLQSDGNTLLDRIARDIEEGQGLASATIFDAFQQYVGSTPREDRGAISSKISGDLIAAQSRANRNVALNVSEATSNRSPSPVKEVARRNDSIEDLKNVFKSFTPKPEDQNRFKSIENKLTSPDLKVRQQGQKEYYELPVGFQQEINRLLNNIQVGRAQGTSTAVAASSRVSDDTLRQQAVNNRNAPNQQIGINTQHQMQHSTAQKVDVTFRGLCVNCATPVYPDAHSVARTDGANLTNLKK